MMNKPNYDGLSLVNLMSSISSLYQGPSIYPPCPLVPMEKLKEAETVILFVLDGLGYHYINNQPFKGFLQKNQLGKITSVYPPTTAAAISTLYTGLGPLNHGVLSWFMLFRELGIVGTTLPMFIRYNKQPMLNSEISPASIFNVEPLFDKLQVKTTLVVPKDLEKSIYNKIFTGRSNYIYYQKIEEMFRFPLNLIKNSSGKKFLMIYSPDFDSIAHHDGIQSKNAAEHYKLIDQKIADFRSELQKTGKKVAVLAVADHGLIDTSMDHTILLEDHPKLAECLTIPLTGEPRSAICFVRPAKIHDFEAYVKNELYFACDCIKTSDMIDGNMFGMGKIHPQFYPRVGDYILLMKENYTIKDLLLGEKRQTLIGNHGGISPEELDVPLIYFDTYSK